MNWRIHTRERTAVLGIVVATEGSTYRKPGSLVLLYDQDLRHGVISGGCLDLADMRGQPLARRTLEIAAASAHHLLTFGLINLLPAGASGTPDGCL